MRSHLIFYEGVERENGVFVRGWIPFFHILHSLRLHKLYFGGGVSSLQCRPQGTANVDDAALFDH